MRLTPAALVIAVIAASSTPATRMSGQGVPTARRQQASATGVLSGSVTSVTSATPARADVSIDRPRRAMRTDSTGRFVFRDLPAGRVRLRAAAFGYAVVDTTVVVLAGDTLHVLLELRMVPQSLAPVRTVAKSP
jgi:carboxypeptidase family protein